LRGQGNRSSFLLDYVHLLAFLAAFSKIAFMDARRWSPTFWTFSVSLQCILLI